ncbi:hypothetical protein BS17DRAFT_768083 [Gyrodon lividus]|nr:hypothetical protein BS17DRAFT_768083 [Gyrodon lividus]
MPQDSHKVRFTSEAHLKAMLYILPPVNESTPVPSLPKCSWIYEVDLSPNHLKRDPVSNHRLLRAPYCPISQLTIPAQPKPRKEHDSEATGHQGHPRDLVIPAAPKATGNCAVRPLSQRLSTKIVIPNGPKQAHRTPTTCQNISTLVLPAEPKTSNHKIDSVQSTPGPSNTVLAPDILSGSDNIAMDVADVDPIPSQTHFLDAHNIAQAVPIGYQDNSEPCKINYKEGLDDPIKRAMEDYHQRISAAFKHCRSVVEQQRWLLEELEKLQMEQEKYAI